LSNIILQESEQNKFGEDYFGKFSDEDPNFNIREFSETHHQVHLSFSSNLDGYIWLPYSFFPYNTVKIDGNRVQVKKSAMNFLIVPITSGEHVLTIQATLSPLRKALLLVVCIGLLFSALIIKFPNLHIF